jgi:hypothetical protein
MRKTKMSKANDLRAEYGFASMRGGVRGKYAARLRRGSNVVLLEADVAAVFPNGAAVNEALRGIMKASKAMRRGRARPNKAMQQRPAEPAAADRPCAMPLDHHP